MRPIAFSILGVAVAAVACTGSGYEAQSEGDSPARITGMLFVERVEGGSAPGVQVGARFLRIVGVSDDVDLTTSGLRPRIVALTGTASPKVIDDIKGLLA